MDLMSPYTALTAPSLQSPGQDLAEYEDGGHEHPEADGEAEETSASMEAGCSDTLDLSRLIRVQSLWGHTTPAILGI